jgi:CRISPR-associated protein Csc2
MSILDTYSEKMAASYSDNPRGRTVSVVLVRRIESEAIFRTEGSGEAQNKEFVHAGLDDRTLIRRVVISKRKQTAVERRTGRQLLRRFDMLYESGDDGVCALNTNNPCESCIDCMVYGYAAGGGGAQKSRVITDDAFSLHPASAVTGERTFNAPFEDGTPWDRERGARMTGLGSDEYVRPEAVFLEIETLKDMTPDEVRYVLGNILRSTRYGAISSRIGKVKNVLAAVAFGDCEIFSNLELTQAVYDRLRGDGEALEFPLPLETVVDATRAVLPALSQQVLGSLAWLSPQETDALVGELATLYGDDEALQEMLGRIAYD